MQQPVAMADISQRIDLVDYHNTCPKCGKQESFQVEVPEFARQIMTGGNTQNFCDDCIVEVQKLEALHREQQRRELLLDRAEIPADFHVWDKDKGNNQLARQIHDNAEKCLFIAGKNDACKTRSAAFNLKLQVTKSNLACRFIRWSDLAMGYARTCKMSSENSRLYIEDFLKNDVLLIDDIGKRRITETAGEMLYDMVDLVYSGAKKTKLWITSNKTLDDLADAFENLDMGDAVVSRLDRMIESGKMLKIETGA
jgi:DNA replication protein DnaC